MFCRIGHVLLLSVKSTIILTPLASPNSCCCCCCVAPRQLPPSTPDAMTLHTHAHQSQHLDAWNFVDKITKDFKQPLLGSIGIIEKFGNNQYRIPISPWISHCKKSRKLKIAIAMQLRSCLNFDVSALGKSASNNPGSGAFPGISLEIPEKT